MGDDGVNVASRHGNNNKQFFRNICASAPGRLIIPSAIVTRHGGENSERQAAAFTTTTTTTATTTTGLVVADTAMPSSAVVEDVGCLSLSEGSQKESVARVHSHSAPAVLLGAPLVNQQQGCSLFWASHGGRGASPSSGRHGSSARRMPSFGLARKSLQEQELADLLERLGQFPVEDMPCDETPPHKASSGRRKRLNSGPSGASPGGSNAIADYGDGAGRVQTTNVDGIGTGGSPVGVPLGNPFSSGRNETIAAAAAAAAHKARVATVPSTAAGAGTTIPREVHRILELHWSSREPLDHGTFEELKRKIESAVKDGAGHAAMPEPSDHSRQSERSNEDQLLSLKDRYSQEGPGRCGENRADDSNVASVPEGGQAENEYVEHPASMGDEEDQEVQRDRLAAGPPHDAAPMAPGSLTQVILKFTTVADGNEAPSFAVGREGATVGRGTDNDICIPADSCMDERDHASIVWKEGAFHMQDRGHKYGASIRIGTGAGLREWPLDQGSVFSAGSSVFQTKEIDEEAGMLLEIVAGPLKGEERRVCKEGATVGRATENTISIADRELSRHHSKVECEPCGSSLYSTSGRWSSGGGTELGEAWPLGAQLSDEEGSSRGGDRGQRRGGRSEYFLCDVGSTNGTYVQLVGPYASSRRLELSDHILIGRTGFSINRFDWGVWEDRGSRQAMEDKSVVIQDMGIEPLTALGLGPQTFLGVYDGHGGAEASAYLWQHLHHAIEEALEEAAPRIAAALQQDRETARKEATGEVAPSPMSNYDTESICTSGQSGISRSGGVVEALRCTDGNVDDDGCGGGDAMLSSPGPGPPLSVFASCSKDLILQSPLARPTAGAASPSALAEESLRQVDRDAARGEGKVTFVDYRGVSAAGGMEGKQVPLSSSSLSPLVEGETQKDNSGGGGDVDRRDGLRNREASKSVSPQALKRRAAAKVVETKRYSAPSLPKEWLLGARAAQTGGGSWSGGKTPAQSAPPLPTSWGVYGWDFDPSAGAGGEAASGVRAKTDGAGGQRGGGDRAGAIDESQVVNLVSASGDEICLANEGRRLGGGMLGDTGRESPLPPSRGRSGAQSPGGEPSKSLTTAGFPAERGGGGAVRRWQKDSKDVEKKSRVTAVDRVIEEVVSKAFMTTDEDFLHSATKPSCGSTATTAMILGDRFYSFNLGDSRTVLCRSGRVAVASKDHKPNREDETERIKRAGGMVIHKRVMGELAVSRAFGDRAFKIGIKAILKEEEDAQQLELERADREEAEMAAEWEEGQREADASLEEDGSDASYEYTTADSQQEQNSLTMGRGITTSASANNLLSKSSRGLMNPSSSSSLLLNPPTRQRSNPSILTENAIPIAPEEQPPPAPSGTPPRPPGPPAANAPGTASQQSNRAPEEGSAPGAVDAAAGVQASDGRARTPPKRVPITDPHDALITAEPEMLACTLSSEDEFVLLACDGLFDVFSSEEVVDTVREEMKKHGDTQRVCETLTRRAIDERGTQDNVSIILVVLKKFW